MKAVTPGGAIPANWVPIPRSNLDLAPANVEALVLRPILFHGQLNSEKLSRSWTELTRQWPILLARAKSATSETGVPGDIWLWLPHTPAAVDDAIADEAASKDEKSRQIYVETQWKDTPFSHTEAAQWYPALGQSTEIAPSAEVGIGDPITAARLRPFCFANGAQSFAKDILDKPRPLITVQVTLFQGKTLISPYWSHILFDGFGSKYLMEAWQAVLGGQTPRTITLDELRALPIESPASSRGQLSRAEHSHERTIAQTRQSSCTGTAMGRKESSEPAPGPAYRSAWRRAVVHLLCALRRIVGARASPQSPVSDPPPPPAPGFLLLRTAWKKARICFKLAIQFLVTRRETSFQTRHVFVTHAYLDLLQAEGLTEERKLALNDDKAENNGGRVGKSSLLFAWVLWNTFWPYRSSHPNLQVQPITLFNLRGRNRAPAAAKNASDGAALQCPTHPFFNAALILPLPVFTPSDLSAESSSVDVSATPALTLLRHARHNHTSVKSALLDASKVEAILQFVTWCVKPKGYRRPRQAGEERSFVTRSRAVGAASWAAVKDTAALLRSPWPYFGPEDSVRTADVQQFLGMSDLRAFKLGQLDFSRAARDGPTCDSPEARPQVGEGAQSERSDNFASQPTEIGRPAAISSFMFPQGYRDRFSVTGETREGVWLVGSLTRREWEDAAGWGRWL